MRDAPLTTVRGGINRLRVKGAARADSLYDLLNGYVDEADKPVVRPGTKRIAKVSALTRGLCSFNGSLHVFCHEQVFVPSGFTLNILSHPDALPGYPIRLSAIHFAEPLMGALYVVAEFEDGAIYHYWLEQGVPWEPNTQYAAGALVAPTEPTGFMYRATRIGSPYPSWAPEVPRSDGSDGYDVSIIEPTVYNDFYYECIDVDGSNPRSGTVEPDWPTEDGAQITEAVDNGEINTGSPTTTSPPTTQTPTQDTTDRYGRGNR